MSARPLTGDSLAHLQRRAERIGRAILLLIAFGVFAAIVRGLA